MMQETVSSSIGETLRQMRRQQSLTQTDLGGEHFSKSYISAVERNKITPSYEALHFFAEQLGETRDYFENLLSQIQESSPALSVSESQIHAQSEQLVQEKILPLLDTLLEGSELYTRSFPDDFSLLPLDVTTTLSPDIQGRYAFLLGLAAQQREDFSTALQLLEQALTLAPGKYRVAILNALGINYYYVQSYYVAINYHERALALLKDLEAAGLKENEIAALIALRLKVEFHCGSDYSALGAHQQAREHFEQARRYLRSAHDIKTAAQLYLKLGYSTYADVYHRTTLTHTTTTATEEIEREFQRAISYFIQSRTLYQVSSERIGEVRARLSQAMVLLDLSTRRRQAALDNAHTIGLVSLLNCSTLLDEAEEQCRQTLLGWEPDSPTPELEILLYTALAYRIRVTAQRATIAHINALKDTAERERSVATYLSQRVLETLEKSVFPWQLISEVATFKEGTIVSRLQTLPRIPALYTDPALHHPMASSIVLFALGEVAEVLGHSATQAPYAEDCYERANQCFQAALNACRITASVQEHDMSYLYRMYLRCIEILQERKQGNPDIAEKTDQTLLTFLKSAFQTSYKGTL